MEIVGTEHVELLWILMGVGGSDMPLTTYKHSLLTICYMRVHVHPQVAV